MERIKIADWLEYSRIIYGMWRLAEADDTSPKHVQTKIEACLEQGITTMDQADIYGGYMAEEIMGNALKQAPHLKDQIEVVTKCDIVIDAGRYAGAPVKYYDTSAEHIKASVDHSLRLMDVDVIDTLLIHRPDPFMDHHETGAALDAVIASGKVKTVGVSNFQPHHWTLLQSAMENKLVTNQVEISVLHNGLFEMGDVSFLQERDIPIMAWSPLAGGELFHPNTPYTRDLIPALETVAEENGVDISAVAIAWLLAHPARIMPVMGTNNLERIKKFSDALKVNMDRITWFKIYETVSGEVP